MATAKKASEKKINTFAEQYAKDTEYSITERFKDLEYIKFADIDKPFQIRDVEFAGIKYQSEKSGEVEVCCFLMVDSDTGDEKFSMVTESSKALWDFFQYWENSEDASKYDVYCTPEKKPSKTNKGQFYNVIALSTEPF